MRIALRKWRTVAIFIASSLATKICFCMHEFASCIAKSWSTDFLPGEIVMRRRRKFESNASFRRRPWVVHASSGWANVEVAAIVENRPSSVERIKAMSIRAIRWRGLRTFDSRRYGISRTFALRFLLLCRTCSTAFDFRFFG